MNTHKAYAFNSVNGAGHNVQTAIQLFEKDGVVSVGIRTWTYANTKKRTYIEKMMAIKLDSFVKMTKIVNQLLSEEETK